MFQAPLLLAGELWASVAPSGQYQLENLLEFIETTWENIVTSLISEYVLCTKGRCHSCLSKINKNRSHDVILIQIMGVIS